MRCYTVLIISSGGALVVKVTMANSNSNIDVGELVANIVNHPDFRQTLTNILQSSSSLNTASSESTTLATASGSLGARPITGTVVGQARVLEVLLLVLVADKILGGSMKIWQQKENLV